MKSGDQNAVEAFLNNNPKAASAKITNLGQTALHVAAKAGHEGIMKKLVDSMSEEHLEIKNNFRDTALVGIINAGNYKMAEYMVRKNKNLLTIKAGVSKKIPVMQAIGNGHIELARYFYTLTPLKYLTEENGVDGATLCTQAIYNRSLGTNDLFA